MPDPMKVVVIDDDPGACVFLKRIIEKAGSVSVMTTTDSKTALALCIREKPGLIILDNVMPEVKGAELAKSLRKNAGTRKIPIIMVTGKGEMVYLLEKEKFEWRPNTPIVNTRGELAEHKNNLSLPEAYGVDHYFSKPVNTQKFLAVVTSLLAIYQKKQELDEWKWYQ